MIVCNDREAGSADRVDSEDHRIQDKMFTLGFATLNRHPTTVSHRFKIKKTIKLCLGSRFNTILHVKYCSCYGNVSLHCKLNSKGYENNSTRALHQIVQSHFLKWDITIQNTDSNARSQSPCTMSSYIMSH